MVIERKSKKTRWLFLMVLAVFSLISAGCNNGSLGVKSSAIRGYVLDAASNQPIPDVAIRVTATVGGSSNGINTYKAYMTGGDGGFIIPDLNKGEFTLRWEKFNWTATGTYYTSGGTTQNGFVTVTVSTGETIESPILKMEKNPEASKGTLRGYPIDGTTGSPLMNFTVSQENPSRFKVFEMAQDFKETGWMGLEGGPRVFFITCENYKTLSATGTIGVTPWDLGVIKMQPETVSITGTLRNMPGYIIGGTTGSTGGPAMSVWAETSNKVVASGTLSGTGGQAAYVIPSIPVSIGNVSVKCKLRGYDVITINPSVNIPKQRPSGTIAGIDADFANIDPIRRDVRLIVRGTAASGQPGDSSYTPPSIDSGEIVRVYIKQGGRDVVPYVDVSANNLIAEAYFTGVITGYPLDFMVINLSRGNVFAEKTGETIPEDGNTAYSFSISVSGSGGSGQ